MICIVASYSSYDIAIYTGSYKWLTAWCTKTIYRNSYVTLMSANFPAHLYTVHSIQIDTATTVAQLELNDSTISMLGRW